MPDPTITRLHHLADAEPAAAADLLRLLRRRGDQASILSLITRLSALPTYNPLLLAKLLLHADEPAEWLVADNPLTTEPAVARPFTLRSLGHYDHLNLPADLPRTLRISHLCLPLTWDRLRAAHFILDCARATQHLTSALCALPPHQHLPLPACDLLLSDPLNTLLDHHAHIRHPYITANTLVNEALDLTIEHITDSLYGDLPSQDTHTKLYAFTHSLLTALLQLQADLLTAYYLSERGDYLPLHLPDNPNLRFTPDPTPPDAASPLITSDADLLLSFTPLPDITTTPLWPRLQSRFFHIVQT
jgi:hypothetical protein